MSTPTAASMRSSFRSKRRRSAGSIGRRRQSCWVPMSRRRSHFTISRVLVPHAAHATRPRSGHRLGPLDLPFKSKRYRHGSVAVPVVSRRLHRRGLEPAARAAVAVLSRAARIRGGSGRQPARSIAACASSKDLRRRRVATVLPPIRRWPGLQDRPVRVRLTGSIAECPSR
jgi:hypothetical protein